MRKTHQSGAVEHGDQQPWRPRNVLLAPFSFPVVAAEKLSPSDKGRGTAGQNLKPLCETGYSANVASCGGLPKPNAGGGEILWIPELR